MQPAVKVIELSKRYRLGHGRRYGSLRASLTSKLRAPWSSVSSTPSGHHLEPHVWALRDVSFDIEPGEVLGLVGSNGAGKSTILKILSRITRPTSGRAELYGTVRSLLEVGTGFHPELTGRENVFLNGAILGMRHREIASKFDEIVAFAEIEKFIDTPVKHYSSGMYVRLAFAVAAYLEPEILLVDEVLAVGDQRFWSKSTARMRELNRAGATIVLVTHNMWLMQTMATRALWICEGRIAKFGKPLNVISAYREYSENSPKLASVLRVRGEEPVCIKKIEIIPDSQWASEKEALPNSGVRVVFSVEASPLVRLIFLIRVTGTDNLPYFTVYSRVAAVPSHGSMKVEAVIPRLMLMPGEYRLWVAVSSELGENELLASESAPLKVASETDTMASFNLLWNEAEWRIYEADQNLTSSTLLRQNHAGRS
jgi:lipopolysaccharide transport system ATP-binding protein